MEAKIMTVEEYKDILAKMDKILNAVEYSKNVPSEKFVDNADFIRLMNISKRTAQTWRDEGVISFSQVGSKIYYRMSDIESLLESRKVKAFKK